MTPPPCLGVWLLILHVFLSVLPCSRCFVVHFDSVHQSTFNNQQQHDHQPRFLLLASGRHQDGDNFSHTSHRTTLPTLLSPLLEANRFENLTVSEIQKELVQLGLAWRQHQQYQQQHSGDETVSKIGNVNIIRSLPSAHYRKPETPLQLTLGLTSPFERVPGCVANVQIRTILMLQRPPQRTTCSTVENMTSEYSSNASSPSSVKDRISFTARLEGHADAILSQGLVVVLDNYIAQQQQQKQQLLPQGGSSTDHYLLSILPERVSNDLHLRQALSSGRNDGLANMMRVFQTQLQSLLLQFSQQQQQQEEEQQQQRPRR